MPTSCQLLNTSALIRKTLFSHPTFSFHYNPWFWKYWNISILTSIFPPLTSTFELWLPFSLLSRNSSKITSNLYVQFFCLTSQKTMSHYWALFPWLLWYKLFFLLSLWLIPFVLFKFLFLSLKCWCFPDSAPSSIITI